MRTATHWLNEWWRDDTGFVLSAEAALLGTVTVLGVTVGLSALSKSVNDELTELAAAFRSLDQSYHFEGRATCRAWTAGSSYQQRDVEESLADLCAYIEELEARERSEDEEREEPEARPLTPRERRQQQRQQLREQQRSGDEAEDEAEEAGRDEFDNEPFEPVRVRPTVQGSRV